VTNKFLFVLAFLLILITSCSLPAARDDFSMLGDDIFSNLIKDAYSEKLIEGGDGTGVHQIDKTKANKFAEKTMLGKSIKEVVVLFGLEGGQCSSVTKYTDKKLLVCDVERKWKLKNIGTQFDTSNWNEPAAKLLYRFSLDNFETIVNVELEIIDITEHKQIYTH
jgi:hypothetical protein